jgi:diguanylate cyclase (GGDEF)-like protein
MSASEGSKSPLPSRLRILLAEDDAGHGELIEAALIGPCPDADVRIVRTGAQVLSTLRDSPRGFFDCILLDFNLPDGMASELLPQIAATGVHCPTLVLSSSAEQRVAISAIRNGGLDFLPKTEALQGANLWKRVSLAIQRFQGRRERRRRIIRRTQHFARLAEQDPLTGASNRRRLDRLFLEHRGPFDRRGIIAVAMVDLDHFKRINDSVGHYVGDCFLREVVHVLQGHVDPPGIVCRYGGEEFLAIRPVDDLADAVAWAERIRAEAPNLRPPVGVECPTLTLSLGLTCCPSFALSERIVRLADRALYAAKRLGRNRVCTWEMELFTRVAAETGRESDRSFPERLAAALRRMRGLLGPTQWNHLTSHAGYVSEMALRIGHALDLDAPVLGWLADAGQGHDLGKFLIPESVLSKSEPLSENERLLLMRHAADGADMSTLLGADRETAEYIRHHHARYDDHDHRSGADHGADGGGIPVGAYVLAVADALVTMTSHRPYCAGRSLTAAIQELRRQRGRQFHPDVVDVLPRALMEPASRE